MKKCVFIGCNWFEWNPGSTMKFYQVGALSYSLNYYYSAMGAGWVKKIKYKQHERCISDFFTFKLVNATAFLLENSINFKANYSNYLS